MKWAVNNSEDRGVSKELGEARRACGGQCSH
jgi:hypothetical protein